MADQKVPTWYGEFNPVYYEPVHDKSNKSVGVNMYLEFKPGDRVIDAKKIGIVNTAKVIEDGRPEPTSPFIKKHKMVKKGVGKGFYIDQYDELRNPVYATGIETDKKVNKADRKLEGYEDSDVVKVDYTKNDDILKAQTDDGEIIDRKYANYGTFGYRYPKPSSDINIKSGAASQDQSSFSEDKALFQDCPYMPDIISNSSEEFETTALVIEGKQKGLYLGSVKWGWNRTGTLESGFNKIPFEIKSLGAPSEDYFKSAQKWNKSRTSEGQETVDLPMSEGVVLKDQLNFYKKDKSVDIDPVKADKQLSKGTRCRILFKDGNYFFIRILNKADSLEQGFVPAIDNAKPTIDDTKALPDWPKPQKSKAK
jgi:hypothetical protein